MIDRIGPWAFLGIVLGLCTAFALTGSLWWLLGAIALTVVVGGSALYRLNRETRL